MFNKQPHGVILIGLLYFLSAILSLFGLFAIFALPEQLPLQELGTEVMALAVFLCLIALCLGLLAWKLLAGADWARLTIMLLQAVGAAICLMAGIYLIFGGEFGIPILDRPMVGLGALVLALISFGFIFYLMRRHVIVFFDGADDHVIQKLPHFPVNVPPPVLEGQNPAVPVGAPSPVVNPAAQVGAGTPVVDPGLSRLTPQASPPIATDSNIATRFSSSSIGRTRKAATELTTEIEPFARQPEAKLVPLNNNSIAPFLLALNTVIGRHPKRAQLVLNDPRVSGQHAKIEYQSGQYVLYDLGSRNKTFRNQQEITSPAPLTDGDHLRFGRTEFRFQKDPQ